MRNVCRAGLFVVVPGPVVPGAVVPDLTVDVTVVGTGTVPGEGPDRNPPSRGTGPCHTGPNPDVGTYPLGNAGTPTAAYACVTNGTAPGTPSLGNVVGKLDLAVEAVVGTAVPGTPCVEAELTPACSCASPGAGCCANCVRKSWNISRPRGVSRKVAVPLGEDIVRSLAAVTGSPGVTTPSPFPVLGPG